MSWPEGAYHRKEGADAAEPEAGAGTDAGAGVEKDEGDTAVNGNANGAAAAVAAELDPLQAALRERDEYLRALQRVQADYENYRKRIARQQDELAARAAAGLVDKLLPVLDALDLAEAHLNETLDLTEDGKALRASRAQLMDILSREGLERIDQAGVPFDPTIHDAVAHSEGDGSEGGTVVEEVLRSGYRWKGQELRAAMVRVRG
jgi:molecular chaperone GrpE